MTRMRRWAEAVANASLWRSPWLKLGAKGAVGLMLLLVLAHVGARAAPHLPSPAVDEGRNERQASPEEAIPVATHVHAPTVSSAVARPAPCSERAGKVVVNEADVEALVTLPGVGRKRAEAIVRLRERLGGRFRRLRDLMRVKGIGPRSFKRLRPRLLLDRPAPPEPRGGDPSAPSAPAS